MTASRSPSDGARSLAHVAAFAGAAGALGSAVALLAYGCLADAVAPVRVLAMLGALACTLAIVVAGLVWCRRREIEAREAAERSAALSELKFRTALEAAQFGVAVVDAEGRILEHNAALAQLLGGAERSLAGRNIAEFGPPDAARSACARLAQMAKNECDGFSDETRFIGPRGTPVDVRVRGVAVRDSAGALRFAVGIVEDVSEQKRLQEQVLLSERMASLGTLAAGIAHEINNPLSFVGTNVRFVAEELNAAGDVSDEIRSALEDAAEGSRRVQEIVRDLKTFARGDARAGSTEDLGAVIRSSVTLARSEIKHRARLTLDLPSLPPVNGSPHRLGQVFLNLLVNAAQALPEGRVDEHEIRVRAGVRGPTVWVEVADTGPGVPKELRQRIFDPFFTTKPPGVGTGLGLSICHGIVTQARGTIGLVPSERGATFRVELPIAACAGHASEAVVPAKVRARVLVVDDEPHVGKALERTLSPQHEVVYVESARRALAELDRGAEYDVVLCDLMMPEVSGIELYEELERRDPRLAARVVFITGGAFTTRAREFLERSPRPRLEKPFDTSALRSLVSRIAARA